MYTGIRAITLDRLELLHTRCMRWRDEAEAIPQQERQELAMLFQATFSDFVEFADLGMQFLGFKLTPMQADI